MIGAWKVERQGAGRRNNLALIWGTWQRRTGFRWAHFPRGVGVEEPGRK